MVGFISSDWGGGGGGILRRLKEVRQVVEEVGGVFGFEMERSNYFTLWR